MLTPAIQLLPGAVQHCSKQVPLQDTSTDIGQPVPPEGRLACAVDPQQVRELQFPVRHDTREPEHAGGRGCLRRFLAGESRPHELPDALRYGHPGVTVQSRIVSELADSSDHRIEHAIPVLGQLRLGVQVAPFGQPRDRRSDLVRLRHHAESPDVSSPPRRCRRTPCAACTSEPCRPLSAEGRRQRPRP